MTDIKVLMPAGVYYVGDLCYVLRDDDWDEAVELFTGNDDFGCVEGKFTLQDGRQFVSFNTAFGDGAYFDQYGGKYDVDSGCIGCIRVKDLTERIPDDGCRVIHFDQDFVCSTNGEILRIDHLRINTASYESEEDYE
jgi:hypothetical protein